jgi:hypothetical protein
MYASSAVAQAQPTIPTPEIKISGSGEATHLLGKKVHIEFVSSEKLTTQLRDEFERRGFTVVPNPQDAEVSLQFAAGYTFQRPHARKMLVDFGRVAQESPDAAAATLADKAERSTRSSSFNAGLVTQGLVDGLSSGMMLGAGLVDTIMSMSGFKGWANRAIAGDERGWCPGTAEMCKDWKKYDQQLRLRVEVRTTNASDARPLELRSDAAAKEEQLVPDPIFRAAMDDMTVRLFGAGKVAVGQQPDERQKLAQDKAGQP